MRQFNKPVRRVLALVAIALLLNISAFAQSWPTATQVANDMTVGWNLGNSLEVPDGETAWGNPATNQQLIDAVSNAGFNTLRIPVAWNSYANQSTYEIDPAWLARVREVVDYGISNGMYVIINSHWDGGWLEEHPTYDMQDQVNEKHAAYWTQVANYFESYDEHLLFAGTNEVRENYGTPTSENIEVQESYNQTFVDAVRATGGNNTSRILIVQTYNTNMWHGLDYFTMPTDVVSGRLMVETHYYDPYDFTLNGDNNTACTVWGQPWSGGDVCSWGQESYVEDLFGQMKQRFSDNDIPVLIGEFGAAKRTSLSGTALTDHLASREYFLEYIADASVRNGMVPVYWDNGYNSDMGFALFNRSNGAVVDQGAIDALISGAGGPADTYSVTTNVSGSGTVSLSPTGGTYEAGTVVTLSASAAAGWEFSNWSGDLTGSENPATITMSSNRSVTAVFHEVQTGGGSSCSNPTPISIPFEQNGAGQYCFVTTTAMSHVNSWNMDELTINGVDFTNTWSNNLPPAVDGEWVISYSASVSWAHFEAPQAANGRFISETSVQEDRVAINVFPNPFAESITLTTENIDEVTRVEILDMAGRVMEARDRNAISSTMQLGEALKPGMYVIKVYGVAGRQTFSVAKR